MAILVESHYLPTLGLRATFVTSGGAVYVVLRDFGASKIRCYKKTDSSFSEQDSANAPGGIYGFDARCDGALIHVITYTPTEYDVRYVTFDTSADQWGSPETVTLYTDWIAPLGISLDSNNKPHVVYPAEAKVKGTPYDQLKYKNKTGASWSAEESVSTVAGTLNRYPTVGHESDDRFVVVWSDSTNTRARCRTRSSAGAWDTEATVDPAISGQVCIAIQSDDKIALVLRNSGYDLDYWEGSSGANPAWSETANLDYDISWPSIGANGTDLYVIYEETTLNDILMMKREDGSWSGPTTLQTSGVENYSRPFIQNPISGNDFDYVFANDTDGNKYWDEYSLGSSPGDIGYLGSVIDTLEFDTDCGELTLVLVSATVIAVAYTGPGTDGWLKTIGIAASGAFTGVLAEREFDGTYCLSPHIFHVAGDVFGIVYVNNGILGVLRTFSINGSTGAISAEIANLTFETGYCIFPRCAKVHTGIFAIAHEGGGNDGWVTTVGIPDAGTPLSVKQQLEFDPTQGRQPDIALMQGDICVILTYRAVDRVYLTTISVDSVGAVALVDGPDLDYPAYGPGRVLRISDTIFAYVFRDSVNDGRLRTYSVDMAGNLGSYQTGWEYDPSSAYNNSFKYIADGVYLISYQGPSNYGWARTVPIAADGTIGTEVDNLNFIEAAIGDNDCLAVTEGIYVVAYKGSPGTIKSMGTPAAPAGMRGLNPAYSLIL